MSTVASKTPVGVFKAVYVLLLLFGLYDVGIALKSSTPVYILAIPGEGNVLVGNAVYLGTLIAAAVFVFAAYLSFEAFEEHRGPFDGVTMPTAIWLRVIEIALRFALISMLTIKLWRPQTDSDATWFLGVVAILLLLWSWMIKSSYAAKVSTLDLLANLALAFFAIGLAWFSSDFFRATYYGLGAFVIMFVLACALFGHGIWLLRRVAGPLVSEAWGSAVRIFSSE